MRIHYDNGFKTRITNNGKEYYLVNEKGRFWVNENKIKYLISVGNIENAFLRNGLIEYCPIHFTVQKLNKNNLIRIINNINYFLDSLNNEGRYYYEHLVEFVSELPKLSEKQLFNYVVCKKGNAIVSIFNVYKEKLNIPFVYLIYSVDEKSLVKQLNKVSSFVKNSVFYIDYLSEDILKKGRFVEINRQSLMFPNMEHVLSSGSYITKYSKDSVSKALDNLFLKFNNVSLDKIVLKHMKSSEFYKYLEKYRTEISSGTWIEEKYSSGSIIEGFHYLDAGDVYNSGRNNREKDYLLALCDGRLVGVIKYGVWDDHQAVAYIDIHMTWRNKGLASYMISEFDKYVYPNYNMFITSESDMGRICKMYEKFKKAITKVPVYSYDTTLN